MDTIKELYYGNIHPYEREVKKDSEIDRLAKLVLRHDAELRKTLNESETELFGKLKDAWAELSGLNECECFFNGFAWQCGSWQSRWKKVINAARQPCQKQGCRIFLIEVKI